MDRAACPQCEYRVGLGMASDPGNCPSCDLPLMLTDELRAYSGDELKASNASACSRSSAASARSSSRDSRAGARPVGRRP